MTLYVSLSVSVHSLPHTHTHLFNGPFSGTTRVSRYEKGKTNLDFTGARETVSGSGISWAICKSASRCRQITMPVPHHSSFFTGRMPFLPPNQQRQSTEGTSLWVAQFSVHSLKGKPPELSTPNSLEIWRRQELGILAYFDTKVKRCHSHSHSHSH